LGEESVSNRRKKNSIIIIMLFIITAGVFLGTIKVESSIEKVKGYKLKTDGYVNAIDVLSANGTALLGMSDDVIVAIDMDGRKIWEYNTNGAVLDVKTTGESILVSSDDRNVYILSLDGVLQHKISVDYRPLVVDGSRDGSLWIVGTTVSTMKNRLQLFSQKGMLWSIDPGAIVENTCFLSNNKSVFYINNNAEIAIVNENGNRTAEAEIKYYPIDVQYDREAKLFLVLDEGNNLYVFDEKLNEKLFTTLQGNVKSVSYNLKTEDILVANSDSFLQILDMQGEKKMQISLPGQANKLKADVDSDTLLVLMNDGSVLRYKLSILMHFSIMQKIAKLLVVLSIVFASSLLIYLLGLVPAIRKKAKERILGALAILVRHKISYIVLLPSILMLLVFNYYPTLSGFLIAFTDYKPGVVMRWVGLDNFIKIFLNSYFWTGMYNMLLFLVTDVIKALIPPIIIAELILAIKAKRAQYWTRVILYLPGILPGVAGLLVWTNGILSSDGVINELLGFLGLGMFARPWLAESQTAIWGLVLIGFPWVGAYIIFYGALISIPGSYFEAARIDGCIWWRRILTIDVPLIGAQIKYVFVVSFIASVQDFGRVYLTTMGGPGHSTYTPMLELYYNMSKFENYGIAAAMGVLLFVVIFGATLMNLRIKTHSSTL
jgi:ABC-type sugar transport system permease subunit/outer membrane protein assembly factor BamB